MILGILDNQAIKQSYSNLMSFQQLKKTFYHTYNSLFNKFNLADRDGKIPDNSYDSYFKDVYSGSNVTVQFEDIAMIEIRTKIDYIKQKMIEFQNNFAYSVY